MRKIVVLVVVAVVLIAAVVWILNSMRSEASRMTSAKSTPPEIPAISPEETQRRIKDGAQMVLLDVRTPEEYDEEYIPGSILVNLNPPTTFVERVGEIIPNKSMPVILFCRSGLRSQSGAELMKSAGYHEVYNLGGIIDWPYQKVSNKEKQ